MLISLLFSQQKLADFLDLSYNIQMEDYILQFFPSPMRLIKWLLVIDLIMLVLHLLFGSQHTFFHLDFEQNLPTTYQSLKLIIFGVLFFVASLSYKVHRHTRLFLLPLSLFLTVLGLDELFQIHENIYRIFELIDWFHPSKIVDASMKLGYRSSLWILYYLPAIALFVFWCGYWLNSFQSKMRSHFWMIAVSSLSIFTILLTEILSSTGSYSNEVYFWLVTVEEAAEMLLASTLILVGSKMLRKNT